MRVCMFVYNRCTTDARVLKEAGTLTQAGHEVEIVAILDATTERIERRNGFLITRVDRNPPHYRLLRAFRRTRALVLNTWPIRHVRAGLRLASTVPPRQLVLAILVAILRLTPLRRRSRLRAPVQAARAGDATKRDGFLTRLDRAIAKTVQRGVLVFHKPLMFTDYYWRAYRQTRPTPADIYHAHDLNTLPVAWAAAARAGAPLIYDAHELYPEISTLSARERSVWRWVERRLIRRTDAVVTVSDSIADELVRRHRIPRPTVVLNCPERRDNVPSAGESPLREYIGGQEDTRPIVLYQGGFAPHRGLVALVRAAAALPEALIVLMGWGILEAELRQAIVEYGLEDRVTIVPPVPHHEVLAYAAGADIGVIPYEPIGLNNTFSTPNKLFDYIAVGLPVVASRLPELVRFVEGGGVGVTFLPGDSAALAAAILSVLNSPARQAEMRGAAFASAAAHTWENQAAQLTDLYAHLCPLPGTEASPAGSVRRQ